MDQVLSSSFVQKVFDEISLEDKMDLWMSAEDYRLQERIEFLASYSQTMFIEQLFSQEKRVNLAKNSALCKGFLAKAGSMAQKQEWNQVLNLTNISLTFEQANESELHSKIVLLRAEAMQKLDTNLRDPIDPTTSETIGFSDCVSIKESDHQGRFTVANRDIEAGELIAIDQPVVKHLDKEHVKTHCWHCLRSTQNYAITPCSMCSGVLFCSEICRNSAQTSYHRHECGLTDILYKSDIGVWILAHKSVASHPKETFLQSEKLPPKLDEYCKLANHYGSDKFTAPELMKEALVCVFLTRCLQSTGYFDKPLSRDPSFGKEELQIALWVHRFMRISRFNCHAIREVVKEPKFHTLSIGVAINPTLAMINHSCDSNYGRVWDLDRDQVKAFATRPIKRGQEITDGYSGIFANVPKEDRSKIHSRYHFDCNCVACEENWPTKVGLSGKLPNGKQASKLKSLLSKPKTLPNLKEELELAYEILKPPHLIISQIEDDFYQALRMAN